MAKKTPPRQKEPAEPTPAKTIDYFNYLRSKNELGDNILMNVYGTPTRAYEIGEQVRWGNRSNVVVVHDFGDGVYVVEADGLQYGRGRNADREELGRELAVHGWFSLSKMSDGKGTTDFASEYRRPTASQSSLDSILHYHYHNGLVLDNTFQREYVWTQADRESLLDTIFDRMPFGALLFFRNSGYLHTGDETLRTYRTLSGDTIQVPAKDNYLMSVIDGQQRVTTIITFIEGRWAYKGKTHNELSFKDQYTIRDAAVQVSIMDESDNWTLKEQLRLFLQVNRGVPQSIEHLNQVRELYEKL